MIVYRSTYFDRIIPFIDKPVIKVLTGIRRCGKSVLLNQIADYLVKHGIDENQILILNFESYMDERVKSFDSVTAAVVKVQKSLDKGKKLYLFFDEIQELQNWEKLINSYLIDFNCDIYITGSNAKLLSGELATYLAGRYIEIRVFPFSFAETLLALRADNPEITEEKAFLQYLKIGGFPFIYDYSLSEIQQKQYLEEIFNSIFLKDIATRYKVRDISLLKTLITFFISNIGNPFSSSSLIKYLKNERRSISSETIYNYLEYCVNSCLLCLAKRENIKGKDILSTKEKIYITDHGIREALFINNEKDIGQLLENIVYIELLRRGYSVTVGKIDNIEIDFCARKENKIEYYQVCYILATDETIKREFGAFAAINDNFPKFVLSTDNFDFSQNGIIHMNIIKWLLQKD